MKAALALFGLLVIFITAHDQVDFNDGVIKRSKISSVQDSTLKQKAFQVIEVKCNVCHLEKSTSNVYTLDNMEDFAQDTYKQVFVKERMPKGKEVKLAEAEKQVLMDWLKTTDVKFK